MKKIISLIATIILLLTAHTVFASETRTVILNRSLPIKFNSEYVEFSNVNGEKVYPISFEGTTYLPIRALSSLFEIPIEWDGVNKQIFLGKGSLDTTSSKKVNSFTFQNYLSIDAIINTEIKVYLNNVLQEFKNEQGVVVYPISYQGTTYLPVRAISNLYNASIEWKGSTDGIEIRYYKEEEPFFDFTTVNFDGELPIRNTNSYIYKGVYVNKAGELIKYTSDKNNFDYGIYYTNHSLVDEYIPDDMKFISDSKICSYKVVNSSDINLQDDILYEYNDAVFFLVMVRDYDTVVIDYYNESEDGLKLISAKRGSNFDLVKFSHEYSFEQYLKEQYDLKSDKSVVYTKGNDVYKILKVNNYAMGEAEAIAVSFPNSIAGELSLFYKDDKNNVKSYPLRIYLKNKDLSKIEDIYSWESRYANYYSGFIFYTNGNVEHISIEKVAGGPETIEVKALNSLKKARNYSYEEVENDFIPDRIVGGR